MGTSLNGLTPAGTYPGLIKTGDNAPIDGTLKTLSDGNGNNLPMSVSTTTINLTGTAQVGGVAIANTTQVAAKQDTLVSGTNIKTINGTSVLGSGDIVTPYTPPSGVSGAIQFSNGSAFASDASNFFWDNTNKRLGIATNAPATALDLRGSLTIQRDATNFTMRLGSLGQINAYIDASTNNQFYLVDATFSNSFILNNLGTGFGVSPIASTKVAIKGSGSTSATTSLLVQNSAGTQALKVSDNTYTQVTRLYLQDSNDFFYAPAGNPIVADGFHGFRVSRSTGSTQTMFEVSDLYNTTGGLLMNVKNQLFANMFAVNYLGQASMGTASPNASAQMQIDSTTRGFLPPRMTTTQKNAIASPAAGLQVYDTTLNQMSYYNGSSWVNF